MTVSRQHVVGFEPTLDAWTSVRSQAHHLIHYATCKALPAILVPRGSGSSSSGSSNSVGGGGGGGGGGVGSSSPGSEEDLGSLADLTTDSVSGDSTSLDVAPTMEPPPTFPPTESPPPGYMSEDGDTLPDITDYPGEAHGYASVNANIQMQ
ncbi:hypothetical protein E2C01_069673 [Portunus trituberculatus]|uniref:Uncharacterized protein n=1 Tax=Portunus trituberculatus TaxID=210409 RepID=A0A5B7I1F5_PORTR|nr:hypothetical protein [Portunus trituberculatus]